MPSLYKARSVCLTPLFTLVGLCLWAGEIKSNQSIKLFYSAPKN